MVTGYTTGVYDLFHVGHLNILKQAKTMCDKLIVGVSTDELVLKEKGKSTIIPYVERREIIESCTYVDLALPQESRDKLLAWDKLKYDLLFVGDDWYHSNKWKEMEEQLKTKNVKVIYFPYTKGTSSTLINEILISMRNKI